MGGEAIHAFQLDDQNVFDHHIRLEFGDDMTLVGYRVGSLGGRCYASKSEFPHERTLVHLFQKAGAKGVRNFERRSNDGFGKFTSTPIRRS